tara:strand:- start:13 stop:402 length:390 start_codon:yes stop_codon:yes gene_type:complete
MGSCTSKKSKENVSEDLIVERSNDKYINCIKGHLYINGERCSNIEMYLYEDYLYIKRYNYSIKISYYDIRDWKYDVNLGMFTFTVKKKYKIITYSIDIYINENETNISDELGYIINEHIKHLKNIGAKI